MTIFSDVYFGNAGKLFDAKTGKIIDPAYAARLDRFLNGACLDGAGTALRARKSFLLIYKEESQPARTENSAIRNKAIPAKAVFQNTIERNNPNPRAAVSR